MGKLKLFISHSSRLDDVTHDYTSADHHWKLLEDTCEGIKAKYGDRVDVLVDRDGLIPSTDWNHHLNLWLSECHAAIIIFSGRAIKKSDWVAKEAAILSWRAELNDKFSLFPVTIQGESSVEVLAKDFLGILKIDTNQCIRDIQTADDIVSEFVQKFGEPAELSADFPQTPLEKLQGGISKLLTDQTTQQSIIDALDALGCDIPADGSQEKERFANLLARAFLNPNNNKGCFNVFQKGVDPLAPKPLRENAYNLFELIRPLWVEASAAAKFPQALEHKFPLLMQGPLINYADSVLETKCYTLERCIERAWPGSGNHCIVTETHDKSLEHIQKTIRQTFLGKDLPPFIDTDMQDSEINSNSKKIILVITNSDDNGGLPDTRLLEEIQQLNNFYQKLIIIYSLSSTQQDFSNEIKYVQPTDEQEREKEAYTSERASRIYLNEKFH